MQIESRKPILVTGAIRTGTTWVGQILNASPSVAVIHEPFNVLHRKGIFSLDWENNYTYVTDENNKSIIEALQATLDFRYSTFKQISTIRKPRNVAGFIRDIASFFYWRHFSHPRPLIKDPIALFSAEWLAKFFNMDVIVLIRHPAAFAWSYKRIKEPNRFADFLKQKSLMNQILYPFEREIRIFAEGEHDPIDQAILLWRICYYVVSNYRKKCPEWIFKKHEDLSLNPRQEFQDIFSRINLHYSKPVQEKINSFTNPSNPVEAPSGVRHQLKRNSKENLFTWKKRLSSSEISRIREGTSEICKLYYSDDSWL